MGYETGTPGERQRVGHQLDMLVAAEAGSPV